MCHGGAREDLLHVLPILAAAVQCHTIDSAAQSRAMVNLNHEPRRDSRKRKISALHTPRIVDTAPRIEETQVLQQVSTYRKPHMSLLISLTSQACPEEVWAITLVV